MPLTLISSERFVDHVTPVGHPERPERAEVFNRVAEAFKAAGGRVIEPRPAADEDLARVHTPEHIDAIVDYDVHHGNGTQWIFYDDPTVLFVSSHQYPFYPGTGAASETGRGAGAGYTLNVPLAAGATDAEIEGKYAGLVMPALRKFKPELLMISAGFDAHELDPLGQLRMTTDGFRRLTAALLAEADALCKGRAVLATEGGYDLGAVTHCLSAIVESSTPS